MMDMIYKVVLTILLVVFLSATGTSILSSQQGMNNANDYFDEVTTVIAESNYSQDVIDACIDEAYENGYVLRVNVISGSEPGIMRYAEAEMDYLYELKLFGISQLKTKHKIL